MSRCLNPDPNKRIRLLKLVDWKAVKSNDQRTKILALVDMSHSAA